MYIGHTHTQFIERRIKIIQQVHSVDYEIGSGCTASSEQRSCVETVATTEKSTQGCTGTVEDNNNNNIIGNTQHNGTTTTTNILSALVSSAIRTATDTLISLLDASSNTNHNNNNNNIIDSHGNVTTTSSIAATISVNSVINGGNVSSELSLYGLHHNGTAIAGVIQDTTNYVVPEIPNYIRYTSMVFCIVIMCFGVIGNIMVRTICRHLSLFCYYPPRHTTNIP